jgi:Fe2+ transport system protein FeoA
MERDFNVSEDSTVSLDRIAAGQRVKVVSISHSDRSTLRLVELGLNPQAIITVLKAEPKQPMIIRVRDTHLAIDQNTAGCFRVRAVGGSSFDKPRHKLRRSFRRRFRRRWRRRRK